MCSWMLQLNVFGFGFGFGFGFNQKRWKTLYREDAEMMSEGKNVSFISSFLLLHQFEDLNIKFCEIFNLKTINKLVLLNIHILRLI